jgi:hypothetical protein
MRKLFSLLVVCLLPVMALAADAQTTTHSASLSWTAVTPAGATYNVLRGTVPGGSKTVVASGLTQPLFLDANLPANSQFCYQVTTSITGMADSNPTAEFCGTTGKDGAPTPSGLVIIFK